MLPKEVRKSAYVPVIPNKGRICGKNVLLECLNVLELFFLVWRCAFVGRVAKVEHDLRCAFSLPGLDGASDLMLCARVGIADRCTEPSPEHANQQIAVWNAEAFINQPLRTSRVHAWVSIRLPPY